MDKINYFSPQNAAERYAKGRPYFHPNTIAHIRSFLQLQGNLENVLDIACGTGLSTKALLPIAENVFGIDIAPEMLKWAAEADCIQYSVSNAEALPFSDNTFDLLTVSSGVHWFDVDAFLIEACRVMKTQAYLIIYENYFISEMEAVPAFNDWFPNVYLQKFPSPPRNNSYDWSNENLNAKHLKMQHEEAFKNSIIFTKEALVLYFTTQSNITAAVESGNYNYPEIEQWLNIELSPFFSCEKPRTICFGNWIKYIQKMP